MSIAPRALDLYDAYNRNVLPKDEGFVISSFFLPDTPYSIFEVVSYSEVKNIYSAGDSVTFQSDGKRIYILVEPMSYNHKSEEPYLRPTKYSIPLRFDALNVYTCKNQYKVMYSKEPQMVMTSFTVLKSVGENFSFIIYQHPELKETIAGLLARTFNTHSMVPLSEAKKVSAELAEMIADKLSWPHKNANTEAMKKRTDAENAKGTAKKPVAKAATKAPAKKPVAKADAKAKPAAKTAAKKPVVKAATKAPAKKSVAKADAKAKPVAKTAAKKPVAKAATKAPAKKTVAKADAKAKPAAKTAAKKPVAKAATKAPAKKTVAKADAKAKPAAKTAVKKPIAKAATKAPAKKPVAKTAAKKTK